MLELRDRNQGFMKYLVNWSLVHYLTAMFVLATGTAVEQVLSPDSGSSSRAWGYTMFLGVFATVVHTIAFQVLVLVPTFMARTHLPERRVAQSLVLLLGAAVLVSIMVAIGGVSSVTFYGGDVIVAALLLVVFLGKR